MVIKHIDSTVEEATQTIQATSDVLNQSVQGTFLDTVECFGNPLSAWLFAISLGLLAFWTIRFLCYGVRKSLEKMTSVHTPTGLSFLKKFLLTAIAYVHPMVLSILAIYVAEIPLHFSASVDAFFVPFPIYALLLQAALWVKPLTKIALTHYVEVQADAKQRQSLQTLMGPVTFLVVLVGWSLVLLIGLDFKGVNVTALVTSLGVGGIALGLAMQNVLGDLIASLSIALDKPFVIGEFIITKEFKGTVTHIGLRSTRLEGLDGEFLVIPNNDLVTSRIRNYTRMQRRRVEHRFNVSYATSLEILESIPLWVTAFFKELPNTSLERVHLSCFGDFALQFEVVYFVEDADYTVYMDVHQTYLRHLLKCLREAHVELVVLPYPPVIGG